MGEKTGFMTVLFIFGAFIIPIMLVLFINNVEGSKLLTLSTEMQQMVSAEGGVSDRVKQVVNELQNQGVTITFEDENGNTVTGTVPAGKKITIHYKYKHFETSNSTTILRRNGSGNPTNNPNPPFPLNPTNPSDPTIPLDPVNPPVEDY